MTKLVSTKMYNFITKILTFTFTVKKLPFKEAFSMKNVCEKIGFE